jgi:hypothetical protein
VLKPRISHSLIVCPSIHIKQFIVLQYYRRANVTESKILASSSYEAQAVTNDSLVEVVYPEGPWVADISHYLRVTRKDSPSSEDELRLALVKFYKSVDNISGMHKVKGFLPRKEPSLYAIDVRVIGAKLVQFGRWEQMVGGGRRENKVWYCKSYPNVSRMQ